MLATSLAVVRKMLDAVGGIGAEALEGERDHGAGDAGHGAARAIATSTTKPMGQRRASPCCEA